MHKLLLRQLKRYIGQIDSIPEKWKRFLEAVDYAYHQNDEDRVLLERSLELTSQELFERNQRLQHDIAEREKAEEALREAKKAAEEAQRSAEEAQRSAEFANQAKSDFLSHMSHELRTPLNGILGYTQLLKRDKILTEQQSEAIDIIHQSGEHLLMMINDILDLSKIEARKMELMSTEFCLPDMLQTIVEIAKMRAHYKGIIFDYVVEGELPAGVHGDEKRLRQVLLNLLSNAVKFTNGGGVVFRVSACSEARSLRSAVGGEKERHSANSVPHSKRILFQVEDTGIGIPPDQIDQIFSAFHQVGDTLIATEGTGLGLAISQQLVRMMDGELHVESRLGQGSTFWFEVELPEVTAPGSLRKREQRQVIGFRSEKSRILIADDNVSNRTVLRTTLASLGFEVIEATNGQEAMDKAIASHPDLILMDVVMPVLGGLEATRRIHQIEDLKDSKIIAISASVSQITEEQSREAGCDGFLAKPFREEELLELLSTHLHLEWIYEEGLTDAPMLTESRFVQTGDIQHPERPLIPPSRDILMELYDFLMLGDIEGLQNLIHQLSGRDATLEPFMKTLGRLAHDFQLEEMRTFLKSFMKEDQTELS